jgi:eukaryotic-like serine/threonine-protein kinase
MPLIFPSTGQILGHYRIIQRIGSGGMGVVYRAHDEQLDRDVALKLLSPGVLTDETARKRLRSEAKALAKLNHPNIASVYDFNTQDETDFLVMELLTGTTLHQKLVLGPLSEKQVLKLGGQLSAGLAAAHAQGVLHCDLKPGNLQLTANGSLKILDFGLAKLLHPTSETATTVSLDDSTLFAGTLPYMAPEQLLEGRVDARTDIYALGAVLYEMASGHRPFPETQQSRLTDAILHQLPVSPRTINSRLSSELERIVLKCLDKEPENRYQSSHEVGIDLRRLESSGSVSAGLAPIPRARAKRRTWMSAIAVFVLLVAMLLTVSMSRFAPRFLGGTTANRIRSLAVLPLENLSGDSTQEYFADGMTEELINNLAKIGDLKVISRTSAMQYKGVHRRLPQIARELNVDAILEGSVLRSGDHVRISTQLIQGATDNQIWSHSYESDLSDVLGLQRDVARATAAEIRVALTPQQTALLTHSKRVNPEAFEAYLKGRFFWNKRNEEGFRKGIEYFHKAIDEDPNYAPAYAGLADSYLMLVEYGLTPAKQGVPEARAAALKAVELDDTLAEAHTSLAAVREDYDWDWPAAEKEFRRAIELNPGYVTAHQWYAEFLAEMGRFDEALNHGTRALDLDPLSLMANSALGEILYESRQYDPAIEQLHKTLDLDSSFGEAHRLLGLSYLQKSRYKEAIDELGKALTFSGGSPQCAALLGRAYAVSGQKRKAREMLESVKGQSRRMYVSPDDLSRLYAGLGDKDEAFRLLQDAFEQRLPSMLNLKVDPTVDELRSDERFQQLLDRVGFAP